MCFRRVIWFLLCPGCILEGQLTDLNCIEEADRCVWCVCVCMLEQMDTTEKEMQANKHVRIILHDFLCEFQSDIIKQTWDGIMCNHTSFHGATQLCFFPVHAVLSVYVYVWERNRMFLKSFFFPETVFSVFPVNLVNSCEISFFWESIFVFCILVKVFLIISNLTFCHLASGAMDNPPTCLLHVNF